MRSCLKCGHQMPGGDSFCTRCGEECAPLEDVDLPGYSKLNAELALTPMSGQGQQSSTSGGSTTRLMSPPTNGTNSLSRQEVRNPVLGWVVWLATSIVILVGADSGLRLWTWSQLLDRTAYADDADLWRSYFEVSYCEFERVVEVGLDEDLYWWSLDAHSVTVTHATRLAQRVSRLDHLFIAPWHTGMRTAREQLLAHYSIWFEAIDAELVVLESWVSNEDLTSAYSSAQIPYASDIGGTFEAARDSFYLAEPLWVNNPRAIEDAFLDEGDLALSCNEIGGV